MAGGYGSDSDVARIRRRLREIVKTVTGHMTPERNCLFMRRWIEGGSPGELRLIAGCTEDTLPQLKKRIGTQFSAVCADLLDTGALSQGDVDLVLRYVGRYLRP